MCRIKIKFSYLILSYLTENIAIMWPVRTSDLILLELGAHQNWPGEVSQKAKLKGGGDGIQMRILAIYD